MSCPCQINTGHHSGSTAAYDQYLTHLHTFHKTDLQLFSNYRKLHKFYLYFSKRHVQKASLHVSFIIFVSKVSIGQTLTNYSSLIKPDMLRFWYQQPSHPPFSPEPDDIEEYSSNPWIMHRTEWVLILLMSTCAISPSSHSAHSQEDSLTACIGCVSPIHFF